MVSVNMTMGQSSGTIPLADSGRDGESVGGDAQRGDEEGSMGSGCPCVACSGGRLGRAENANQAKKFQFVLMYPMYPVLIQNSFYI